MTATAARRALLALVAATLVIGAAACADEPATPESATSEIVLDWFPNADHAGIYAAAAQGHFAAQGLDVRITQPSDAAAALKQVGAGRADFAVSYQPEVLLARAQGVPVVAVGALVTHPLNSVIARRDAGIRRPRDLEGRTVGATGLPSDRALLETVIRADGGDPGRVRVANIGFTLGPAIAAGRVDALIGAYWNIEVPEIEDKGVPVEVFRLEDYGVPDYDELVLVTADRVIADEPAKVTRMLAALRDGALAARADPDAAVDAVVAANPDLDRELVRSQVVATLPLIAPDDEEILALDPGSWARYAEWMRGEGLLTAPLDPADAVNAELLADG